MNNSRRNLHVFQLNLLRSDDGDGMLVMTDERAIYIHTWTQSELIVSRSAVQISLAGNSKRYLNRKYHK